MGKAEAFVEDYLRRRVREEGGHIRKLRFLGRRGAADNMIWWQFPAAALIECKRVGEVVDWESPQGREIARMRAAGWSVFIVNSREQVDAAIASTKGQQ